MAIKISALKRKMLFAFIMSGNTALITTGFVIYIHAMPHGHFVTQWLSAFVSVWPVVFLAILLLAPFVNKLLDYLFVEDKIKY